MHTYDWAVLRVVPRVERGESVNAGVILYCRTRQYLEAAVDFDEARALALDPALDVAAVRAHLRAVEDVCAGRAEAGANGSRPQADRFHWLTAPRSTVVQPSAVHTGMTDDPAAELERLLECMVRPPTAPPLED